MKGFECNISDAPHSCFIFFFKCFPFSVSLSHTQKVDILCGIGIKKVACGTQFSVALTKDGHIYTFGQGECSRSAFGLQRSCREKRARAGPRCPPGLPAPPSRLSFVPDRLIGLPEGRARNHNRPQQVPALSGVFVEDVAVGAEHTLALTSAGDVYAWGSNSEGQVCTGYGTHEGGHVSGAQLRPPCLSASFSECSSGWATPTTSGSPL